MRQIALLSRCGDIIRAAILHNGSLVYLDGDDLRRPYKLGTVYQGKVNHIERGQCWVDLNPGIGLLSFDKKYPPVTVGQTIPVQISREAFYDIGQKIFKSPLLSRDRQQPEPSILVLIPDLKSIDELIIDDAGIMAAIKPEVISTYSQIKLSLSHKNLFKEYGLEENWDDLLAPKVIRDNFNFTIEETSACTVIDVNGVGYIRSINEKAAQACAQQIYWRHLSGAIMVEFINHAKDQRPEVIKLIKSILPSTYTIHGFSKLGFLEISSPRTTAPLSHRFIKKEA